MKNKIALALIFSISILFYSCDHKGVTDQRLYGDEEGLPPELKGLKIYTVSIGGGNYVRVAYLEKNPISLTYRSGKVNQTTILINKNDTLERTIEAKEIISENDSIVVIKK